MLNSSYCRFPSLQKRIMKLSKGIELSGWATCIPIASISFPDTRWQPFSKINPVNSRQKMGSMTDDLDSSLDDIIKSNSKRQFSSKQTHQRQNQQQQHSTQRRNAPPPRRPTQPRFTEQRPRHSSTQHGIHAIQSKSRAIGKPSILQRTNLPSAGGGVKCRAFFLQKIKTKERWIVCEKVNLDSNLSESRQKDRSFANCHYEICAQERRTATSATRSAPTRSAPTHSAPAAATAKPRNIPDARKQ